MFCSQRRSFSFVTSCLICHKKFHFHVSNIDKIRQSIISLWYFLLSKHQSYFVRQFFFFFLISTDPKDHVLEHNPFFSDFFVLLCLRYLETLACLSHTLFTVLPQKFIQMKYDICHMTLGTERPVCTAALKQANCRQPTLLKILRHFIKLLVCVWKQNAFHLAYFSYCLRDLNYIKRGKEHFFNQQNDCKLNLVIRNQYFRAYSQCLCTILILEAVLQFKVCIQILRPYKNSSLVA